jgi:uncharacterized protein with NAD-binding domain and iron-sulfur cluster
MQKKVVILGGGIGGLSAAHELMERGFAVEIYESRRIPGGKARSEPAPHHHPSTVAPGGRRKPLQGEHGFRFFPGFYKHVTDTMQRIPDRGGRTVFDNLVDTTRVEFARFGRPPITLPSRFPRSLRDAKVALDGIATFLGPELGIPREELAFFVTRTWQIMTSCKERRLDEYEKISWWDFIRAEERSRGYQYFFGHNFTRSTIAANARLASARTIGDIHLQLLFDIVEPGMSSDRVLNGPTNDVWIDPWLRYLTQHGVQYHLGARVTSINYRDGEIHSVTVEKEGRTFDVQGDYFVSALPVEDIALLLTPELLEADAALGGIQPLARDCLAWMVGIQLYLTTDVPITSGHSIYVDSPWALTSISQAQFWPDIDLRDYADGHVRGIISVDISEWDEKGLNGKTAKECSWEEIAAEVWEQLKRSLNVGGKTVLKDEYLHYWYTEPDVYRTATGQLENEEPLLVNLKDTWALRPDAVTRIPNFFLAADYVRTYTDLATMEGANEAARRAVNGIIEASGMAASACQLWELHEPEIFAPWREIDRVRYHKGLPWDDTLVTLALSTLEVALKGLDMLEQGFAASIGAPNPVDMATGHAESPRANLGQAGVDSMATGPRHQELIAMLERDVQTIARRAAEAQSPASAASRLPIPRAPAGLDRAPMTEHRARRGRVRIIPS